jgi:hypothetical protein
MVLYFMHQRTLGEASWLHSSIVTATPPDLPLGWSDEEVQIIQDKLAIKQINEMRFYINSLFERVWTKLQGHFYLFFVAQPKSKEEAREFFIEAYTSVSTRYIQYEYNFKYPTYVPLIEFSNFTPDQPAPLYRIVNSEGKQLT